MAELGRVPKKQLQEQEEKLIRLYADQKQRAIDRIGRGNGTVIKDNSLVGGGKVRQMFDERRQKAGIDRSYPLEPLKQDNSTFGATSKIAVRINTNTRKISSIPNRSNVKQTNSSDSTSLKTINGNVRSYQSPEDTNNINQQDVLHNMNRLNIEDNKTLADIEQVYNGVVGKLANVGGKRPSEVTQTNNLEFVGGVTSNIRRKEMQAVPLIKKTVKPSASPTKTTNSPPSTSSSLSSTMSKSQPRPNQPSSARAEPKPRPVSNPVAERTPNTQRPSAKQTPRGPSAVQRDDLDECRYCHRRFAGDRLQTHEDICARTAKKKRKQYDATQHRLEGTELIQFVAKSARNAGNKSKVAPKPNSWRQKHEEFIATIRSAKIAQQHVAKGGKLSDLPPPPPSSNPDFVQCPHCGRRFNEAAAERHIPKCANYDFNKPKPGASKGRAR